MIPCSASGLTATEYNTASVIRHRGDDIRPTGPKAERCEQCLTRRVGPGDRPKGLRPSRDSAVVREQVQDRRAYIRPLLHSYRDGHCAIADVVPA
jgi:hypothetical protein